MKRNRRKFLRDASILAIGGRVSVSDASVAPLRSVVSIDPKPLFDISPYLYMQFMEPLGVTDSSVEAAWDRDADDWRKDLIDVVKDLAPDAVRWGGLYSRYYKWREGVGPAKFRPPMRNYVWGGIESNRAGTREFVDFCRRVGAEPLMCVNFLSDGDRSFWKTSDGQNRSGDAAEAADWVSYCNDPDHRERREHGSTQPDTIKLWQLGNETSYGEGWFSKDETIRHTIEFAKAMKARDPSIQLIGWGDRGPKRGEGYWAADLIQQAGEHLDYVAMHMMGQVPLRPDTVLKDRRYQQDPEQAWEELLEISKRSEARLAEFEQVVSSSSPTMGIAITEGHLSLRPHNANLILYEWLTGVFHARAMNMYQRHGARVKIATAADFCGTRWTVNAVMIPVPAGKSYLMPVASVMRLFKRHNGKQGVAVKTSPSDLDIAATRSGNHVFLHVANLSYSRSSEVGFWVEGMTITGGRVLEIAPEIPRDYVSENDPNVFDTVVKPLPSGPSASWSFPAASVSVVVLEIKV
jgi:alpha-N-arabinofuranosidase